jgi:hypothetical protein
MNGSTSPPQRQTSSAPTSTAVEADLQVGPGAQTSPECTNGDTTAQPPRQVAAPELGRPGDTAVDSVRERV